MNKKLMKLSDLKEAIDKTVEYAGTTDPNVEFWYGDDEMLHIKKISQFGVVPDVMFTFHVKEGDNK